MYQTSKIKPSFRPFNFLLMFCLLFQFINVTSAAAAPAAREHKVTNVAKVLKQLTGTANNVQAVPSVINASATWPLMTEGFEGTFPQGAWSTYDNDGATNGEYFWGQNTHIVATGTHSAWVAAGGANGVDPGSFSYPNNVNSWLVYGPVDLATYNTATFQFKYWNQSELDTDYFGWYTSTDGINFNGTTVSGDSLGWVTQTIDLSPYYGDSSVWIAFNFTSNATGIDDGAFIDDVLMETAKAFVSDFNGNAAGWGPVRGPWRLSSTSYFTRGIVGKVSSIIQTGTYSTFNYEVRMKRTGCFLCANRLYVRANQKPINGYYYEWGNGYLFQYSNYGDFSIYKAVNGVYSTVQYWTKHPSIKAGWNVLRVVGRTSAFKFYINGALVWSGVIRGLPSGKVGIGVFNDYYSTGNLFNVDWATLDTTTPLAVTEENETVPTDVGEPNTTWNDPNRSPGR